MVAVTAATYLATPLPEVATVLADSSLVQVPPAESQAKQEKVISVLTEDPEVHSLALQERSPAAQMTSVVAEEAAAGMVSLSLFPLDSLARMVYQV
jgi:hypothetical protein